jgi:hypothetical protein
MNTLLFKTELNQQSIGDARKPFLTIGALVILLYCFFGTGTAHAGLCITPPEQGAWKNYDPNTRSITRLLFEMECWNAPQPPCTGDICTSTSEVIPHYFIHLYGKCHPTDCDWGRVEGQRRSDGWYRFNYNQGFATRYVWARTYPQWPGWFRLYIWNDFTDPNRADYATDEWFVR